MDFYDEINLDVAELLENLVYPMCIPYPVTAQMSEISLLWDPSGWAFRLHPQKGSEDSSRL